jgi:hypothetical protein
MCRNKDHCQFCFIASKNLTKMMLEENIQPSTTKVPLKKAAAAKKKPAPKPLKSLQKCEFKLDEKKVCSLY